MRTESRPGRRWPAVLLLVLLAPFTAEVSIGDLPFNLTGLVSLIFFVPIYGAGALLARELIVRRRAGIAGLFVLGLAYCLIEEGLGLQSLTSPSIYHGIGPAMGGRITDVNGVYLFLQLINHAVWSITLPVVITDLVFPAHRGRRYLRLPGLIITPVVFLLGVGLVALSARTSIDPGYRMPTAAAVALLIAVCGLVFVAVGLLGGRSDRTAGRSAGGSSSESMGRPELDQPPAPWVVLLASLLAAWGFLAPLWLPGHFRWPFVRGIAVIIPVLVAAAVATGYLIMLRRWGALVPSAPAVRGWTARHQLAAAAGLFLAHAAFGASMQTAHWRDRIGVTVLLVVCAVVLAIWSRRSSMAHNRGWQATEPV